MHIHPHAHAYKYTLICHESWFKCVIIPEPTYVSRMAYRLATTSSIKLSEFRSQPEVSYVSSHTEELWYNETVYLCITIYIYIYIYGNTHTPIVLPKLVRSTCPINNSFIWKRSWRNENCWSGIDDPSSNPGWSYLRFTSR